NSSWIRNRQYAYFYGNIPGNCSCDPDGYHIRRSYGICSTGYRCNADYSFIINTGYRSVYRFKSGLVGEPEYLRSINALHSDGHAHLCVRLHILDCPNPDCQYWNTSSGNSSWIRNRQYAYFYGNIPGNCSCDPDGYHIRRSYGICSTGYRCNADYSFIINTGFRAVYRFKSGLVGEPEYLRGINALHSDGHAHCCGRLHILDCPNPDCQYWNTSSGNSSWIRNRQYAYL